MSFFSVDHIDFSELEKAVNRNPDFLNPDSFDDWVLSKKIENITYLDGIAVLETAIELGISVMDAAANAWVFQSHESRIAEVYAKYAMI